MSDREGSGGRYRRLLLFRILLGGYGVFWSPPAFGFRPKVGTRYGPMGLPVSIANYSGEHCVRGLGGYAKQRAGDFLVGYQAGCPGRLANQVDALCGAGGRHGDLEPSHIRER